MQSEENDWYETDEVGSYDTKNRVQYSGPWIPQQLAVVAGIGLASKRQSEVKKKYCLKEMRELTSIDEGGENIFDRFTSLESVSIPLKER